jgi:hypothetical protein
VQVLDTGLPERLRDVAVGLTSSLRVDRASVTDADLKALSEADVRALITYLGRRTTDQPTLQKYTVAAMLRLVDVHPGATSHAVGVLKLLPAQDLDPVTALKFKSLDEQTYLPVMETWKNAATSQEFGRAVDVVIDGWGGQHGN